jgi:hypothetical protein
LEISAGVRKSIVVVFILGADLIIPLAENYKGITTWVTVIGDMGTTCTGMLLTRFQVLSQKLFEGTTEKHENSQLFFRYLGWDWIFPLD